MGDQGALGDAWSILAQVAAAAAGQAGAENFPVALRVLPARPRELLERFYAYARFVDDVGDEAPGDRLALLELIAAQVRGLDPAGAGGARDPAGVSGALDSDGAGGARGGSGAPGAATLPVIARLRPLIAERGVPVGCLLDLIEANRVDQTVTRYQNFEDLLGYCQLSANPVGRVVLHVAGQASPGNIARSDAICSGLQVLEHCQDVGEDARAGRVYLPQADLTALARPGGGRRDPVGAPRDPVPDERDAIAPALLARATSAAVRDAVAVQVVRARRLLAPGAGLVRGLRGWARVAVAGYVAGGLATADALADADYDVLARPIGPAKSRLAWHAVKLLAGI
ncbi:MAG: squalene/phytoene synthase family protein [Actinomycetia bacterium]|nr:squalene/phytoene synthase family protein [Actinomycetes bacterium]